MKINFKGIYASLLLLVAIASCVVSCNTHDDAPVGSKVWMNRCVLKSDDGKEIFIQRGDTATLYDSNILKLRDSLIVKVPEDIIENIYSQDMSMVAEDVNYSMLNLPEIGIKTQICELLRDQEFTANPLKNNNDFYGIKGERFIYNGATDSKSRSSIILNDDIKYYAIYIQNGYRDLKYVDYDKAEISSEISCKKEDIYPKLPVDLYVYGGYLYVRFTEDNGVTVKIINDLTNKVLSICKADGELHEFKLDEGINRLRIAYPGRISYLAKPAEVSCISVSMLSDIPSKDGQLEKTTNTAELKASKEYYKRHFIILFDTTKGSMEEDKDGLKEVGKMISNILLKKEDIWDGVNKNKINMQETYLPELAFDPSTDEVSLFTFGMTSDANKGYSDLSYGLDRVQNAVKKVEKNELESLTDELITPIAQFKKSGYNIDEFIKEYFAPLFSGSYNGGINLTSIVYPCILTKINTSVAASEYYVITISNFKVAAKQPNSDDYGIIRTAMCNKSNHVDNFNKQLRQIKELFYTSDYMTIQSLKDKSDVNNSMTHIKAIKAVGQQLGVKGLQGVSMFITSNIGLVQEEVAGTNFKLSPISIAFTHDHTLEVEKIVMGVLDDNGEVLCEYEETNKSIIRDYFNANERKYEFPERVISFNREVSPDEKLQFKYIFFTNAKNDSDQNILPFVYEAERDYTLVAENFKSPNKTFGYLIFIIATIIIIAILIIRGQKKTAEIYVSDFLDEYIDITPNSGSIRQSCLFCRDGEDPAPIPVMVKIKQLHSFFALPWQQKVYAYIDYSTLPDNVNNLVKYFINNDYNRNAGKWVRIDKDKNGDYKFNVNLSIDKDLDTKKLYNLQIEIKIKVKTNFWGLFESKQDIATYEGYEERKIFSHYLIEDLGNVWVGIDPGTTGSCVAISGDPQGAVGNPNINMVEVKNGNSTEYIIPSKLILDEDSILSKELKNIQPGIDYVYGCDAERQWNSGKNKYQSIKKLLGYKKADGDKIKIKFNNGIKEFSGVELAYLLVKGLKKNLDEYVTTKLSNQNVTTDMLRRAVVAIPNNYTLPKILDMVDSIKMLDTFKEVRYIYEAEGVLFYYLYRQYHEYWEKGKGSENIMVYDMGGATINVSIFNVEYYIDDSTTRFNVSTLARIGYAVGGDNIDVALLETILTMPELNGKYDDENSRHRYETSKKNKTNFLSEIYELKKEIVGSSSDNYYKLSNYGNFEAFIKKLFSNELEVDAFKMNGNFTEKIKDRLTYKSRYMKDFVYNKIEDAISEVINFNKVKSIDKIIFSGRSTMFPGVKETVCNTLNRAYNKLPDLCDDVISPSEIKSCVAAGACWYGRYGLVTLDNSLINGAYGFKFTEGGKAYFKEVLGSELNFTEDKPLENHYPINSKFPGDGNNVCFYQVMGNGKIDDIFAPGNRHKLNFLGAIHLMNKVNDISIKVDRNDKVEGTILYESGHQQTLNVEAQNHDMVNDNEWPYIFHILDEEDIAGDINNVETNSEYTEQVSNRAIKVSRR